MEPGSKNKSPTLKRIILQYLKLNSHWGEGVSSLISDRDPKLNSLNYILTPIIDQSTEQQCAALAGPSEAVSVGNLKLTGR